MITHGTGHGHGNHAQYYGYLKRICICYARKIDIGTEFYSTKQPFSDLKCT